MTRRTIVTCECCGVDPEEVESRMISVGIGHNAGPVNTATFDACLDCLAKVTGHSASDKRCIPSIAHQSQQAVLAMFKAEVKKFDESDQQKPDGSGGAT